MELSIPRIDPNRNYWFLRTQSGDYYDAYRAGSYVAIGWDALVDLNYLKSTPEGKVVEQIRQLYPKDSRPRHNYNQMVRFIEHMRVGDVVVIPSNKSHWLSIGVIESDVYIEKNQPFALGGCPFRKRRKVRWERAISRRQLDAHLFPLINSQHTLSNANGYADYIDRAMHSLYFKGSTAHLVLNVRTKNNIPTVAFASLLSATLELVPIASEISGEEIHPEEVNMRTEVQSPGHIELYFICSSAIVVLGLLIVFISGGTSKFSFKRTKDLTEGSHELKSDGLIEKLLKWRSQSHKEKIQTIEKQHRRYLELLDLDVPDDLKELVKKRLESENDED